MFKRGINKTPGIFLYLWGERFPLLTILGFFAFACLLVSPLRDVPVNDDWAYAWSARTHRLTHLVPLDAGDVTLVRFVDRENVVAAGTDHTLRALRLRSP